MALRYKILLADDDEELRGLLRQLFLKAGHVVFAAGSGREALLYAVDSQPDLVVCDVQLPDMDGFEVCRRLRGDPRSAQIPVLFMSGSSRSERQQLEGFSLGAEDYVLKPFPPAVLLAKADAVLRRHTGKIGELLRCDGVVLDPQARTVTRDGRPLALSRKEFDLLALLLRKRGRVLSPQFLLESVWGLDLAERNDPRTVVVHVSSLRRKLGGRLARRIVTVAGSGYRFEA